MTFERLITMNIEGLIASLIYGQITEEEFIIHLKKLINGGLTTKLIDNTICYGSPVLCILLARGYLKIAEYLISIGCNVNLKGDFDTTPLMHVCHYGNLKLVKLLLGGGTNIDEKNYYDKTALMMASSRNYKEIVELLLQSGADTTLKDNLGKTAYDCAKENDNMEICEMLELYEHEVNKNNHIKTKEELEQEKATVKALARRIRGVR